MINKKKNSTSSPAEIVGSIDDLLTEFFLRLPLKPLFQLKLVSRHWNSLISDPKLHSSRHKKPVGFIFQIPDPTDHLEKEKAFLLSLNRSSSPVVGPPSITEMYVSKIEKYKQGRMGNNFFHSCNGLLVGYLSRDYHIMQYFVYNPTTREYKSIPRRRVLGSIHWMYLAFDPSKSPHYNVVCVLSSSPSITKLSQFKFAVYSSKTRSWKKYDNEFSSEFKFENGVYWNGSIHWISLSKTEKSIYFTPDHDDEENVVVDDDFDCDDSEEDDESVVDDDEEKSINFTPHDDDDDDDDESVVFDHECVSDDGYCYCYDDDVDCGHHLTVFEMPTPPILGDESKNYFGESCDHLNFISYYGSSDDCKLKVYEMRRDYSEWFVKYSVDVSNVRCPVWNGEGFENLGCPSAFDVCGLVRSKKGNIEDDSSFLVLMIKRRMVVYNVVNGTFEITSEFDEKKEDKGVEFFEGYDKFHAFRSRIKQTHSKSIRFDCPLQYIESLCLV